MVSLSAASPVIASILVEVVARAGKVDDHAIGADRRSDLARAGLLGVVDRVAGGIGSADQDVVAGTAGDRVVSVRTVDRVGEVATDECAVQSGRVDDIGREVDLARQRGRRSAVLVDHLDLNRARMVERDREREVADLVDVRDMAENLGGLRGGHRRCERHGQLAGRIIERGRAAPNSASANSPNA